MRWAAFARPDRRCPGGRVGRSCTDCTSGPRATAEPGSAWRRSSQMGRGRAKAKQTKVARELKYRTSGTDLGALRAELAGAPPTTTSGSRASDDNLDDEDDEPGYDGRYDVPDDDEDEDSWAPARR